MTVPATLEPKSEFENGDLRNQIFPEKKRKFGERNTCIINCWEGHGSNRSGDDSVVHLMSSATYSPGM